MTNQADPNSKRSKRRKKRNFTMSRPNRRADERKRSAERGYQLAVASTKGSGAAGFTKPGSQRRW